jgi:hypothetical protein
MTRTAIEITSKALHQMNTFVNDIALALVDEVGSSFKEEKKKITSSDVNALILKLLGAHVASPTAFSKTSVISQYFDTVDKAIIELEEMAASTGNFCVKLCIFV